MRTARAPSQAANAAASNGTAAEKRGRTRARHLRGSTLPAFIAPHTAMAAAWPPDGDAWLYEIDFDGERVLARRSDRRVTLFTASGDDCTARYAAIADAVQSLPIGEAWLDGEAVAIEDAGAIGDNVRYALFDLMFADGEDLRERPLSERRERLELALADAPPPIVYSSELAGGGATLLREACGLGLAGLIAKRKDSPYESGRTRSWLELKCRVRDEVGVQASAAQAPAKPAKRARSRTVQIEDVRITNPDRPITRGGGATKLDVVRYHQTMAPWIVPHIAHRPLALVRCTGGDLAQCFFQKHMGREQGNVGDPEAPYVLLPTLSALIEALQNGVFELHTWGSSIPRIDRPDRITLDLDPDSRLAWSAVREATAHVRALLDEIGLRWFIKTTGGKGLHFVMPIERRYGWATVKEFAGAIARHLARTFPDVFTATMSKAERTGRVFVDYLRNAEGATAIAAYSLRARPDLPVSMPIEWDDLADDVRGAHFNWRNASEFVATRARDPWGGYDAVRQRLSSDVLRGLAK